MKIERTLPDGRTVLTTEADSPKDVFRKLAIIDSLFSETQCGCCESRNIHFNFREVDNGAYYEMKCQDCQAALSFGQNKDNKNLFAKRWDKEARAPLPNNGWSVYQGNRSNDEHSQEPTNRRMAAPPPSQEPVPF